MACQTKVRAGESANQGATSEPLQGEAWFDAFFLRRVTVARDVVAPLNQTLSTSPSGPPVGKVTNTSRCHPAQDATLTLWERHRALASQLTGLASRQSPNNLSAAERKQIEELAERFELQCKQDSRLRIEDFLELEPQLREPLLRELLTLEEGVHRAVNGGEP